MGGERSPKRTFPRRADSEDHAWKSPRKTRKITRGVTGESKTAYVVDDDAVSVRAFGQLLARRGYRVVGITDPKVALEEIPAGQADLVLLDVHLGEGINGVELAVELLGKVDVPIVFLTGASDL